MFKTNQQAKMLKTLGNEQQIKLAELQIDAQVQGANQLQKIKDVY
jgi:hypothetical protein